MNYDKMKYLTVKQAVTNMAVRLDNRSVSQMYKDWIDVDIACDCPQHADDNVSIEEIYHDCCSWFGLKRIESPFESDDFLIMVDMYGGGSAQLVEVYRGESSIDIIKNLLYAIKECCECCGYGIKDGEYVLIEEMK